MIPFLIYIILPIVLIVACVGYALWGKARDARSDRVVVRERLRKYSGKQP